MIPNPFLKEGVLSTNASINKLVIAKMPECTVTQPLAGRSAQEIFSTDLLIQEIKNSALQLQIDISALEEKSLPLYLESCLESEDANVRAASHSIMKLFGERLAVILLCLKEGSPENRNARSDWGTEEWDYWNSLHHIILVGGLASPPLGEQLKYYVEQVFWASGKHPYTIILGKDSTYAGLRGCTTYLKDIPPSQVNLIFDYGQSFIKRSYAIMEGEKVKDIIILGKTLSRHVEWDIQDTDLEEKEALALNRYFLETITRTVHEVENRGLEIHPHIILSIANYVKCGVIANRGGYGKLRLIAPNYAEYLSQQLRESLGRSYYFTMLHDGTAMAAGYANYDNSVCISLGTAFGVGFPVHCPMEFHIEM
ncbi:hypothetical protein D3Z45_13870 [Lachnospiraceae bacterium]|nr:hypothetical protein [Lachnospiraceae bacterium]